MDGRDLGAQVVRHGRALLFVLGVDRVPEGWAFGIKHASRVVAAHFFAQALHHVDHASNGPRGRARRVARYGTQVRHGVESSVQVAGAIDQ